MRIIITKTGKIEFQSKDSPTLHKKRSKQRNASFASSRSSNTNRSEWNKNDKGERVDSLKTTHTHFPLIKPSYVDINENKITAAVLSQATKITLKKPRILFEKKSKQIIAAYQDDRPSRNSKRLSSAIAPISLLNDHSSSTIQLRKILSEKAISALKKEIITKEEAIIQQKKQSEEEFRTVYSQWNTKIDEFEHMLTKEIKADKSNLINYFSQKEDMSVVSFNHLCSSSNDQLIKINKICQIMLNNQETREKDKDRIREKLNRSKYNLKMRCRHSVDNLTGELNHTKSILAKYAENTLHRSQYKVLVDDIRRVYWDHYNIDRVARRTNKVIMTNENKEA